MTRTKMPYLPTYCGRQSPGLRAPHWWLVLRKNENKKFAQTRSNGKEVMEHQRCICTLVLLLAAWKPWNNMCVDSGANTCCAFPFSCMRSSPQNHLTVLLIYLFIVAKPPLQTPAVLRK